MKVFNKFSVTALALGISALASSAAQAISVTQTNNLTALSNAITAGNGGITITNISISGQANQFGTFTNASGTYGIGSGFVFSTGNVSDYSDGLNTNSQKTTAYGTPATAAQNSLLTPITGQQSQFDVAQVDIEFDLKAGFDTIFFNTVFGSEEFPQFVNSSFIDGFGLIVNGQNIAFTGGNPANINNPDFQAITGTELNGVLAPKGNPVVTFSKFLGDGKTGNKLTFIIADTSDSNLDSTAYFSALGGAVPTTKPVPVPPAVAGVILAGGLLSRKLFKRSSSNKNLESVQTIFLTKIKKRGGTYCHLSFLMLYPKTKNGCAIFSFKNPYWVCFLIHKFFNS